MDLIEVRKHDHVFDKIKCDPGVAQEISDYFTFDVPGAKFSPAVKNKFWDGKIRIFNKMSCLLYCGLRQQLEQFCRERSYAIEYDFETAESEFSIKECEEFYHSLGIDEAKFEFRDYQAKTVTKCIRMGRALGLSPTGSGKSFIIWLLTKYYDTRTLIIVPTVQLVHQMVGDFEDYKAGSLKCHKIYAGQDKYNLSHAQVVVTTWQSIADMDSDWFNQFDVMFGDEVHLFKAKSLVGIMEQTKNVPVKFGFTGTLDGTMTNKLILEGLFGPVVKFVTTAELIQKGVLAEFAIKAIVLEYPDAVRQLVSKMTYQEEIDYLVRNEDRNRFIKNLAISLTGNTLLLFQYVEKHGTILHKLIAAEAKNRKVFFVHGGVEGEVRESVRAIVEKETDAIIIASSVFTTGTNIKNISNLIFASPSKSRIKNLQSIGRGLRRSDTKTSSVLYDVADDLKWKSKKNYTLLHFIERAKLYMSERFKMKIYQVKLKTS